MSADAFLLALFSGPLMQGDAIVVCCGEDGAARARLGMKLFAHRAAPVLVLSGGVQEPPAVLGARHLADVLIAEGVAPDRLVIEDQSQHTRDQAERVLLLADQHDWHRLLLVASAYHLPRAYLTFVARLQELGRVWHDDAAAMGRFHILPVPASEPWWEPPPGRGRTRMDLWHVELTKINRYRAAGDCATWEDGLAALQAGISGWGKPA